MQALSAIFAHPSVPAVPLRQSCWQDGPGVMGDVTVAVGGTETTVDVEVVEIVFVSVLSVVVVGVVVGGIVVGGIVVGGSVGD